MKKKHTGDPSWHRGCEVAQLIRTYQNEILEIFKSHQSHVSIGRCRVCEIEFLTSKSNAGRTDLLCPFGCRARQRAEGSRRRSKRHYETEFGRSQKKALNHKRSKRSGHDRSGPGRLRRDRTLLYYRWLIWVVEGRRLSVSVLAEVLAPIFEKVRQHSLEIDTGSDNIPDS